MKISAKMRKFFADAAVMTIVSLIMRTIAVSFNSYITGRVGAEGMGLYSLITSVYTFAVTFATSGINLGVTRTVAEAMGRGTPGCVRREMRRAIGYALLFGCAAFLLTFFGAPVLGHLLGDVRTVRPIRAFAVSLPFIALSSCMNGYFCAVRRIWKNAAAQLFEQGVKIVASAILLTALLPAGLEYACLALVCGGALAETLSVGFAAVCYFFDPDRRPRGCPEPPGGMRRLCAITLPVAFSAYVRSALVTVEHMLIPRALRRGGLTQETALSAYGALQGMALPVVLFPTAFSATFASLLVPEAAQRRAAGDAEGVRRLTERAVYGILAFDICAAGILIAEAYNIADWLYPGTPAGDYIRALACVLPVMLLDTVADGLLKGVGEQVYAMKVNIVDASLSVLCVALFLPKTGIWGYVGIIIAMEVLNCALSLGRLLHVTGARISPLRAALPPAASIALATPVTAYFSRWLSLPDWAGLCLRIWADVGLYLLLFFLLRAILSLPGHRRRAKKPCHRFRGVI